MSKAYDGVEWDFISMVMQKMRFPTKFRELVMQCICSVSFSMLLNGEPMSVFRPERGLRQGDPLSPYLFVMCAQVLLFLLNKAQQEGVLQSLKVSETAPSVSHLFFADDSILFGSVST